MNGWIAILVVTGTTGLVAYLSMRRRGAHVTTVTHTVTPDAPEK